MHLKLQQLQSKLNNKFLKHDNIIHPHLSTYNHCNLFSELINLKW